MRVLKECYKAAASLEAALVESPVNPKKGAQKAAAAGAKAPQLELYIYIYIYIYIYTDHSNSFTYVRT